MSRKFHSENLRNDQIKEVGPELLNALYDGTFNCVCDKGYEKTAAGHCEDVDECQEPGKNVCMAPGETCENTMPGFRCTGVRGKGGPAGAYR